MRSTQNTAPQAAAGVSNLQTAREYIEAELSNAREGLAYFASRAHALEHALADLDSLDGAASAPKNTRPSVDKPTQNGNGAHQHVKRKTVAAANPAGAVPPTRADFWLDLITAERRSAVDIAHAAAQKLGLDPKKNRKQVLVLKQRVGPSLASLVSGQKIKDTGTGRARRFYRQ
jgi:hypothetical protein